MPLWGLHPQFRLELCTVYVRHRKILGMKPVFVGMSADGFAIQVEPQEKKKTPKGRAKKRITYTRRFVNVTMTGGKRKVRQHSHENSLRKIPTMQEVEGWL